MALDLKTIYYDSRGLVTLYEEFSENLKKYIDGMENNLDYLTDILNELGNHWVGADYREFREGMGRSIDTVEGQIDRVVALKNQIDISKEKLGAALELMRTKIENI